MMNPYEVANIMIGNLAEKVVVPEIKSKGMLQQDYFTIALEELQRTKKSLQIFGIDKAFWQYATENVKGTFFKQGRIDKIYSLINNNSKPPIVEAMVHDPTLLNIIGKIDYISLINQQNKGFMISDQRNFFYWDIDRDSPIEPGVPLRIVTADKYVANNLSGICMNLARYTSQPQSRT